LNIKFQRCGGTIHLPQFSIDKGGIGATNPHAKAINDIPQKGGLVTVPFKQTRKRIFVFLPASVRHA
jgi:hypothetical protein